MNVLPIINYIVFKNLLSKFQHGFIRDKSTNEAIIEHLSFLYNNIGQDNSVFFLFLDFKKAFDYVDHHILLSNWNFMLLEAFHSTGSSRIYEIQNQYV